MAVLASVSELYAHAIAIEREAAARYSGFAERMQDEGRDDLAHVFAMLAGAEAGHLEALERRTQGIALPSVPRGRYDWLYEAAPEAAARELVFRLMTPRQALAIALQAERRAQAFFETVSWTAPDPAVRALAKEMAIEELGHATLIADLLDGMPEQGSESIDFFEKAR